MAKTPNIYKNKFHIDFYNFIQQCKDYFILFDAWGNNYVLFVITFLKKQALFQQQ